MKLFLLFILSFFALPSSAFELHSGDIILISFNCFECRVIESETNSSFSHSGVVLKGEQGEIFVAQALGQVKLSSMQEFLKNLTPGTRASIFRPFEFDQIGYRLTLEQKMREVFERKFKGLPFDSKYLWNNFDQKNRELLYCSEFVSKFLDQFLSTPSATFPLTYQKNYDYWMKYFRGQVPEGEMGNSPASLATDPRFYFVGTVY